MKLWVLDTNVVLSGLMTPDGICGQVLKAVKSGNLKMAYDIRILAEYRDVLSRPHFCVSPQKIANFLSDLRNQKLIAPTRRLTMGPDPADLMFIEVALETPQKTIITGNLKDFPRAIRHGVRVLTPAQAVQEL